MRTWMYPLATLVLLALASWPAIAAPGTPVPVEPLQEQLDRSTLFPPGVRVVAAVRAGRSLHVDLDLGRPYDFREMDALVRAADRALGSEPGIRGVFVRVPDEHGVFRQLPEFLPHVPVPDKGEPISGPPVDLPGWGDGALAGKTVYLSQCHGWYWTGSGWYTQRPNLFDTVEDFHNTEAMNQYLMRYLLGAGARVVPIKESDLNEQMAIVDDADAGYDEDGFASSGSSGFASGHAPYAHGTDPFELGGTRVADTATDVTATATWTPDVPADGHYQVYVSYKQDPSRAPDAHYVVHHPGADTHVRIDQRIHGSTWVYLGRFYFYAGEDPLLGSVELRNDSATAGATVSADAVRFGGGMGDVSRGGAPSGHERWEEAAIYATQFNGAPPSVYDPYGDGDGSDPSSRSRFADYEHEDGEDAVYYSWHSNACGNCGASGTSIYVYSTCDVGYDCEFSGIEGGDVLAQFIQDHVVDAIRAEWDADWSDRGLHTAWFAEVNPNYNDEMPAALIELAFHDTESDTQLLKHPRFRRDTSRAMMQGIIDYFADRDGIDLDYPPEPPTHLAVRNSGPGQITASWSPSPHGAPHGDAATGYRVYTSRDGRAFDDGVDVSGTDWVLDGLHGYEPVYVRVTATNDGGESFPTATLGAIPSPAETEIVFVQGFDRMDRGLLLYRDAGGNVDWVTHMDLDRMNRYDYAVEHLAALAALGVPVDGVSQEVVADGGVAEDAYGMVAWASGQESVDDESFGDAEQSWVRAFRDGGGGLFVTGGEIGWDLDSNGDATDLAFYQEVLLATLLEDDAATYAFEPTATGIFAGLGPMDFDDGTHGTYDVDYPDVLEPEAGAEAALVYDGNGSWPAAITADGLVYFGVPFEAILGASERADLMDAVVAHLLPGYEPPEWPEGDDDDAADDDAADDDDGGLITGPRLDDGCQCAAAGRGHATALGLLAALLAAACLRRQRG